MSDPTTPEPSEDTIEWWLILKRFQGNKGLTIRPTTTLGSGPETDICLTGEGIQELHALFQLDTNGPDKPVFTIKNETNDENAILLNGEPLLPGKAGVIKAGTIVQIGSKLRYRANILSRKVAPGEAMTIHKRPSGLEHPGKQRPVGITACGIDRGKQRESQQDALGFYPRIHRRADEEALWVVADGVAGTQGGDLASKYAVQFLLWKFFHRQSGESGGERLKQAIKEADRRLIEYGQKVTQQRKRGQQEFHPATTIAAVALLNGRWRFAHVGDSKIYLLQGNKFRDMWEDHSYAGYLVREKGERINKAARHPKAKYLYYSVGGRPDRCEVYTVSKPARIGDRVVLCTDGLDIPKGQLYGDLTSYPIAELPQRWIDHVNNEGGGKDNIAVIVIEATDEETVSSSTHPSSPCIDNAWVFTERQQPSLPEEDPPAWNRWLDPRNWWKRR